jgi:hypothetical protein
MKLRVIAILFAFALTTAAARAQVGVYASFDAEQFNRSGLYANPPAGVSNSATPWLYGSTFGAYYNVSHVPYLGVLKTGPVTVGFDARGDFLRGAQYARADALIGLRVATKTPIKRVTPYIQGSAGLGHTKLPGALYYTNNWSYQFAVGADRKIKGRVDWRVVEASAGFLGSFVTGTSPNGSNYNYSLGTGLVVRLP